MPRTHANLILSLVRQHIIKDERIKTAMLATDRLDFSTDRIYEDAPQPIGYNVTISAPHMHAYALEMLRDKLIPGAHVLDVGSGSGYLTACMARLVQPGGKATGIEHLPELVQLLIKNISKHGRALFEEGVLEIVPGDGRLGYSQDGPYDAIHVGAAAPTRPNELIEQLKPGGRLVVPVGTSHQKMMIYEKSTDGQQVTERATLGVSYVPLTDKAKQWRH